MRAGDGSSRARGACAFAPVVAVWLFGGLGANLATGCARNGIGCALPEWPREPKLATGDSVTIGISDQPALTIEGTIRPDGMIDLPVFGELQAAGRSVTDLKWQMEQRLDSRAAPHAHTEVAVTVTAWNPYRFGVQGEVAGHAGVYGANQPVTVLKALALAGGPTRFAKRNAILVFHTDPQTGTVQKLPINYDALVSGQRPDMNIVLRTDDTIWVP